MCAGGGSLSYNNNILIYTWLFLQSNYSKLYIVVYFGVFPCMPREWKNN